MIDWKRFAILTFVRAAITAGIATGLCFLFPAAMPWIIGISAGGLGVVSVGSIIAANTTYDYSDVPRGDLEFYQMPGAGLLETAEENVIDFIEDKIDAVGDKISDIRDNIAEKRQRKKEAKQANNIQNNEKLNNDENVENNKTNENDLSL